VVPVADGQQAVKAANERRWDIILMDMQMPLMDGPDATQTIRKGNGPSKDVPIIALTADAVVENRRTYLEAGCNVVATKPIDWAVLANHIATLLNHDAPAAPAPAAAPVAPAARPVPPAAHWRAVRLLNRPLLDELAESIGKDTLAGLVASTLENLRLYVAQLHELLREGKSADAMRLAHQIKGAAGQTGAERAAAIARVIEVDAKAGAAVTEAAAALESCLSETAAALDAYFSGVKEAS
jgi:CheY-like chemotaxis protein